MGDSATLVAQRHGRERCDMTPERWQEIKVVLDGALEIERNDRAAFLDRACAHDASLRHEVEVLLAADEEIGTAFMNEPGNFELATVDSSAGNASERTDLWIGRRIGPYKIVERIGIGGFGEVYRAFRADDQYRKEVALKVVRGGQDSGFVFTRFKNERQILASLEHPNIARLHDGGTTADGVPYFVMELIDGQPLDQYCNRRQLSLTERLSLFLQVCSAVQYAHQRLIIHRDIKPSNILVTSGGTPTLLDFGIAKILDTETSTEGPEPTLTVFRALTPGYASPEQVKGDSITTASDVYSLGIVLYELLTGQHPYRHLGTTPQELALAVCEVEPEKPSTVVHRMKTDRDSRGSSSVPESFGSSAEKLRKRLRGDLDNIVLMALRKEPQRRYASVEQFAEDIRRHLGRLPVVARTDTFGYRTSKFVTRHKAGVTAAIIVAGTVLAGLAVTVHEARIARAQQVRAEQRFNDVRRLANSLIFEIHDSIETMPGATPTRKLLLERALEYLDSLAKESSGDVSLQRELAAAYLRIGSLQGSTLEASLGQSNDALASLKKAVAIRQAVVTAGPNNASDQLDLAIACHSLARMMDSAGQPGAREQADEALAITGRLVKAGNTSLELLRERAIEYELLSDLQNGAAEPASALDSIKKSLAITQELLQANPQDRRLQRGVAIGNVKVANWLVEMGSRAEALQFFQSGLDLFTSLVKDQTDARSRRELAVATVFQANALRMNGDTAGALAAHEHALTIIEPMAGEDPQNVTLQLDRAGTYSSIGTDLMMIGRYVEAQARLRRAIQVFEEVLARNHSDQAAPHYIGTSEICLGEALAKTGKTQEALETYQKGITRLDSLGHDDPDIQSEAATGYVRMGRVLAKLGRTQEAADHYRKALVIAEPLAGAKPPNTRALYAIADAYFGMGELSTMAAANLSATSVGQRQRWTEAHDWCSKSVAARSQIPNPGAVTPSGLPCGNPAEVTRAIARCNAALATLRTSDSSVSNVVIP
jgi:serine/threonine protein kinase/tetratricopeptide (TPR) repeat protein